MFSVPILNNHNVEPQASFEMWCGTVLLQLERKLVLLSSAAGSCLCDQKLASLVLHLTIKRRKFFFLKLLFGNIELFTAQVLVLSSTFQKFSQQLFFYCCLLCYCWKMCWCKNCKSLYVQSHTLLVLLFQSYSLNSLGIKDALPLFISVCSVCMKNIYLIPQIYYSYVVKYLRCVSSGWWKSLNVYLIFLSTSIISIPSCLFFGINSNLI